MNFLRRCVFMALLVFVCGPHGQAAPSAAAVKAQATVAMKQLGAGKYDAYADCLYSTMLDTLGGRAEAPGWIKQSAERLIRDGWKITREVGEPSQPVTAGGKAFAVVPTLVTMESPTQKSVAKGYWVAISTDGGATWKFVDCTTEYPKSVRETLVPDLPATVQLPEHEDPQLSDK